MGGSVRLFQPSPWYYAVSDQVPPGQVITVPGNPSIPTPPFLLIHPDELAAFLAGCPPGAMADIRTYEPTVAERLRAIDTLLNGFTMSSFGP